MAQRGAGAKKNPAYKIDWKQGNKWGVISQETWAQPGDRLARAKGDLIKAGFHGDAEHLTEERLNNAWKYVPDPQQAEVKKLRLTDKKQKRKERLSGKAPNFASAVRVFAHFAPKKKKKKKKKKKTHSRPRVENKRNHCPGTGLTKTSKGQDDEVEAEEGDEGNFFSLECVLGEDADFGDDDIVRDSPLYGGVFVEKQRFEGKMTNLLVVLCRTVGSKSAIGRPMRVNATTVRIPVTRSNEPSFVQQLLPENATADNVKVLEQEIERGLQEAFGAHCDISLLNNAWGALVPKEEKWYIEAQVRGPFKFRRLEECRVFHSKGSIDAFAVFPLEKDAVEEEEIAPMIAIELPARAQNLEGTGGVSK
jgi:hypothetical protein